MLDLLICSRKLPAIIHCILCHGDIVMDVSWSNWLASKEQSIGYKASWNCKWIAYNSVFLHRSLDQQIFNSGFILQLLKDSRLTCEGLLILNILNINILFLIILLCLICLIHPTHPLGPIGSKFTSTYFQVRIQSMFNGVQGVY